MRKAIIVAWHAKYSGPYTLKRLKRSQIGRRFDQDAVATIDEQFGDQVERLLRAGGDHHVLGLRLDSVSGGMAGNHLAQRFVTFGGAILQGLVGILLEHPGTGFAETFHGENVGRGAGLQRTK